MPEERRQKRLKFDTPHLAANSAVASIGAGAAAVSATGMIVPTLVAATLGGILAYTVTNEIPKNGDNK